MRTYPHSYPHSGRRPIRVTLAVIAVLIAMPAAAALPAITNQNLAALTRAAVHWLRRQNPLPEGKRRIRIQPPDPRLDLPRCPSPRFSLLNPAAPGARVAIRVRCLQPVWQLFLNARVTTWISTLVARRALGVGTRITRGDVKVVVRPLRTLPPSPLSRPAQALGQVIRIGLAPGMVLSAAALTSPLLIHQGERLDIVAAEKGLRISVAGIAMQAGRRGERILVRNASSGRVLRATVTGRHRVQVGF